MEKSLALPLKYKSGGPLSLGALLKLNSALRKTLFSRNFYQQITDKVLTNSASIDANLYFVCYFTLMVSAILQNKQNIKKFLFARIHNVKAVMVKYGILSPHSLKKAPVADIVENEKSDEPASKLAVHLKAISSYIADVRIFNRLTDSIKYMPWVIDEFHAMVNPLAVPRADRIINFLQSMNCLVLELLENAGWLTEHNWVGTGDNDWWCIETYIWCCRVWGLYLVIEILELIRRTPTSKWDKSWRINLFKQVIQIPLVLHWSLYDGCLTPFWVGFCGSGASWWGFKDLWGSLEL